jgi:hypothetical protein
LAVQRTRLPHRHHKSGASKTPNQEQDTKSVHVSLGDGGPDDLPKAFRREREQTQGSQKAAPRPYGTTYTAEHSGQSDDPVQVVITGIRIPFLNLVGHFLKVTVAAIPAILLLLAILFGIGQAVSIYAPQLAKVRVLIHFPQ